MSIDYNKLRELVAEMEKVTFTTDRYSWLAIARELLRLRDGVEELAKSKGRVAEKMHKHAHAGDLPWYTGFAAAGMEVMCDELANLLEGEDE